LEETKKTTANVKVKDMTHSFAMDDIFMICEARIEEMFEFIDKELQRIRRSRKLPGGAVITGGTAKLPGLAHYAKEKLQIAARIGKIHNVTGLVDTVEDEVFTTAVGLMLLDMLLLPQENCSKTVTPTNLGSVTSFIQRLWR
jgi:cell division ATPase FtsA